MLPLAPHISISSCVTSIPPTMKRANPKSFHAFWVFQQILQRGCPLGCALGVLVAAAGTPVTVMDVCKAKFRLCLWLQEAVLQKHLHIMVIVLSSPLWLTDVKFHARIYSRLLTQGIHSSPDNNLMKCRCYHFFHLQVRKPKAQSGERTLPLHPSPTCPQANHRQPSGPTQALLPGTGVHQRLLPHHTLCTVLQLSC